MKYAELIRKMTLEEKASLLSGTDYWHTQCLKRLGIPEILLTDGPHGLRLQRDGGDHLGLNQSVPATCFPTAATLACSWDTALAEEVGSALGTEAAVERAHVLLGPGLCIKRDPRCGRNFEYFSEDPLLSGKMAAAMTRGIQSKGCGACLKHFAVNNQEKNRMVVDAVVDERALREIYLTGFEIAVKEGRPRMVMSAYNKLNGIYCSENERLLQEILYGEWGFDGVVVTDWGAENDRVQGLIAGNQLEMPGNNGETDRDVVTAVREGRISEELLDLRVDELLTVVFELDHNEHAGKPCDRDAHHALARRAAEGSVVLLKNEGGVLPVRAGERVAVIGDFARRPRYQGVGSSNVNPTRLDDDAALAEAGLGVIGYAPGFKRYGGPSRRLCKQACALAQKADKVLVYLGLNEFGEAEGVDRPDLRLPQNQIDLLEALSAVNDNLIVVLSCGAPVEMPWEPYAKAILHGYLGGQAGAGALARVIAGAVNPSGKLAESYPFAYEDTPAASYFPGRELSTEYRESVFVGYRYYDTAQTPVRYPFGYGLSYTHFSYHDLVLNGDEVTFTLRNDGDIPGAEVAQVYVAAHIPVFHPEKELRGFIKLFLEPGESRMLTVVLPERAFQYWNTVENRWVTGAGRYDILVGASSADIRLSHTVEKAGEPCANPYDKELLACYFAADVRGVPDETFAALLGRPLPQSMWRKGDPITMNQTIETGRYGGRFGKFLYGLFGVIIGLLRVTGRHIEEVNVSTALVHAVPRPLAYDERRCDDANVRRCPHHGQRPFLPGAGGIPARALP